MKPIGIGTMIFIQGENRFETISKNPLGMKEIIVAKRVSLGV